MTPERELDHDDPELAARLHEEAVAGRLPLLRDEREYGTRGILFTSFAASIATWCFLIGGYAANVVGAAQGTVTLIAGCVIGVFLSAAASALGCNRYGLEQIDFSKSCFGQRGARVILVFYTVNQIGWTGIVLVMCGSGIRNVLKAATGFDGGPLLVSLAVLFGMAACYAIVIRGVHMLNVFNTVVTPGLFLVTGLLFWVLFSKHGWSGIAAAPPLAPQQDALLNYAIAFEYGLGAGFSWWPGIGYLTRNTDTQRNALYPQLLTYGLVMGVACCSGLYAGLLFRTWEPTEWMLQAGGLVFGVLALLLVAIANLSASALMLSVAALGLRHVGFLRKLPWKLVVAVALTPVLGYAAFPTLLYEKGGSFLAWNATMYAPISGVMLVDYLFLRRQRINPSQIFEDAPTGHYWFSRGFNWVALLSVLAGQGLYLWLFDPVTSEGRGPFRYATASAPSVVVAMALYFVGAKLFLVGRKGGYGEATGFLPLKQPNI